MFTETPETPPQEESKNVIDSIFSENTTDLENEEPTEAEEEEETEDVQVMWKRVDELTQLIALVQCKQDLMLNQQNSLKGIVKTHTTKITTIEKAVRQMKDDADTEFNSIHTKHNQLEHSTDTRVAAVEKKW